MTECDIQRLILSLPGDAPYFNRVFGMDPGISFPLAERLRVGLSDPALGWNMAQSCAAARVPLPSEIEWPLSVHRAYSFLIGAERNDENLTQAKSFQTPQYWFERNLIRALLLCKDATEEIISQSLGLEVEVVVLFHDLWWNVKQRRGELLYLAQLLDGRLTGTEATDKNGLDLLRLARRTGKLRAVLLAARLAFPTEEEGSDETLTEQIAASVLNEASLGQQMGLVGKAENPALALAEKYLLADSEPKPSNAKLTDPLMAIGLDPKFQAVFKEHVRKQRSHQMRAALLITLAEEELIGKKRPPEYEI